MRYHKQLVNIWWKHIYPVTVAHQNRSRVDRGGGGGGKGGRTYCGHEIRVWICESCRGEKEWRWNPICWCGREGLKTIKAAGFAVQDWTSCILSSKALIVRGRRARGQVACVGCVAVLRSRNDTIVVVQRTSCVQHRPFIHIDSRRAEAWMFWILIRGLRCLFATLELVHAFSGKV